MTSDVARLIKVASNEISRDINKFASKYGLTGNQVQIIYYLANSKQENSYQASDSDQYFKDYGKKWFDFAPLSKKRLTFKTNNFV